MILKSTNTLWALDRAELIGSRTFSKSFLHSIMLHKATLLSELGVQPGLTHLLSIHSEQDPF